MNIKLTDKQSELLLSLVYNSYKFTKDPDCARSLETLYDSLKDQVSPEGSSCLGMLRHLFEV